MLERGRATHTSSLRKFIPPFSCLYKWWLVYQRKIALLFFSGRLCVRACVCVYEKA